jgi:hypothetical protein
MNGGCVENAMYSGEICDGKKVAKRACNWSSLHIGFYYLGRSDRAHNYDEVEADAKGKRK